MENKIITIQFIKEDKNYAMDIGNPQFETYIKFILENKISVDTENISIDSGNIDDFDVIAFKEILVEVDNLYRAEITDFFININQDISTYYTEEEVSKEILEYIKKKYYTKHSAE